MTTTAIDVNTAFADERAAQIAYAKDAPRRAADAAAARNADTDRRVAEGKLIPIGGNQYRVNDPGSYDDGEVWTIQRATVDASEIQVVLPQHGLDETTGRAAVYSVAPMWHNVGTVIPGGTNDIDKVLDFGGIAFDVRKQPVQYRSPIDGTLHELADHFVTIREDTGAGLGVVGARYKPIQNRDAFEFLQDLSAKHDVVWESAGALREGRRVFVSMRLPETIAIDVEGVNEEIVPFVVALNSHDGSSLFHVVVTPWRPVCGNTERFAMRDAHSRWGVRHTGNARQRIDEARRTLRLSSRYFAAFKADEEALARTELALREFRAVCDELWPAPDEDASERAKTNHAARLQTLTGLYETNAAQLGKTAYAAERAITEFADWRSAVRPTGSLRGRNLAARATAVLEGANDDVKSKAHRRLLTLVRR